MCDECLSYHCHKQGCPNARKQTYAARCRICYEQKADLQDWPIDGVCNDYLSEMTAAEVAELCGYESIRELLCNNGFIAVLKVSPYG